MCTWFRHFCLSFGGLIFVAGCAQTPISSEKISSQEDPLTAEIRRLEDAPPKSLPPNEVVEGIAGGLEISDDLATEDEIDSESKEDDEQILKPEPMVSEPIQPLKSPKKSPIPFEFNRKVAEWIHYFSKKDRDRFQRYLDRGEAYREVVENILEQNRVPADLYYLGMIESGFNYHAKSTAKAVGVWQFMKPTGKQYGLKVDSQVDERKDPIRATEAAARHLRDLYKTFGSWYLALSAYNAGTGRIQSAIRRGKSRNFWELVERKILPKETSDYVPKFLAARYLGENPEKFALYINEDQRYPDVELVSVPSKVKFDQIEKDCGIPRGTLHFVNPHYRWPQTRAVRGHDEIWVPIAFTAQVRKKASMLSRFAENSNTPLPSGPARYSVRKGDTLAGIASRSGLSVSYLKRLNGLRSSKIVSGQKLLTSATQYRQWKAHPRKKASMSARETRASSRTRRLR